MAEYAAPVWARSAHVYKLDSLLNNAFRAITGCLKPTRVKRAKQETNEAHSFYRQIPSGRRLQSRNCFLHYVKPENFPLVIRCSEWLRTNKTPHRTSVNIDKTLAGGHDSPWTTWRCINSTHRLHMQQGAAEEMVILRVRRNM